MTRPRHAGLIAPARDASLLAVGVLALPGAVPPLRRLLAAFAETHGASIEVVSAVELCVTEAAANVVRHAYPDHAPGPLHVVADVVDGALEVVVADDGHGVRQDGRSDGAGLGLGLVARHASRFTVGERRPHGVELWMRFELGGG